MAAGAWTPSLQGRTAATGQILAYLPISDSEQRDLKESAIYFNVSRGMYKLPPHGNVLNVGRHGFGYQNQTKVVLPRPTLTNPAASCQITVGVLRTDLPIPAEGEMACKHVLADLFPHRRNRGFSKTRVCWYCDT